MTARQTVPWLVIGGMVSVAAGALYVALAGGAVAAFAEGDAAGDLTDVEATDIEDAAEESGADIGVIRLSVTNDVFLTRDPFDPVVPEPVQPTSTDGTGDTAVSGGDDANGTDGGTVGSKTCANNGELVCNGRVLSLVSIADVDGQAVATIQVDDQTFAVIQGQTFANDFQLVMIEEGSVLVSYGDATFEVRLGARLLK